MKKFVSVILILALALGTLTGCGAALAKETPKLHIVTTIFPIYDWVMNILGKQAANAEVNMLLDNGVDLHSYQPTADDIIRISSCDLFIYVGGESDEWVEDALQEATNKDMRVISLMEVLGDAVKEEEVVEGMEHEHEEEHEDEEVEYDEHVWLSLKNAAVICRAISDALGIIDCENAALYAANADAYFAKLNGLDTEYQAAVDAGAYHTILFGDRFPFRYLADDYGVDYYAAFVGCSAETEASFETVIFLANKLDELGLPAVLQIETADGKIARALCATGKLLLLDEPVSGLDPKVTAEMYELIERLNREKGITVIMISHDIGAALRYASHILHIGDRAFFGTNAAYRESGIGAVFTRGGEAQ